MPDKIYTRRGDDGTTGLLYGGRISKASARAEAVGTGDEAVSALGLARAAAHASGDEEAAAMILDLQRGMAVLNAELMTSPAHWDRLTEGLSLVPESMAAELERLMDSLSERFEQPRDFVVPGNTALGAALDHAGRIVRRAERRLVALAESEEVRPQALRYVNRLSDMLWMLARFAERGREQPAHHER